MDGLKTVYEVYVDFLTHIGITEKFIPLAMTVTVMLGLLMISKLVDIINRALLHALPHGAATFICRWLTFPGVIIHESSHALLALITGAKVTKVVFFKPEKDVLGYVSYIPRGGFIFKALQKMLSSVAPVVAGPFVVYGMISLFSIASLLWLKIVALYVAFSMIMHMDLSDADVKEYLKGCAVVLLITVAVTFIFG